MAIINYDISIIDFIDESADIYQVVHGDYENEVYTWQPPTHPRIKAYIGVTKYIRDSFKRITGLDNVIYGYNPLTIEEQPKKLVLVSATRLSPIKGKDRMVKLANALDTAKIDYIWYIFTNDVDAINSPNVVYMKPRLDIGYWMDQADYIVQLSDTEACSYTINEALYRNKPVIVTPLPYLSEIGVKDGLNAYIMKFDCSNISNIVKKIHKVPSFTFKQLQDSYDKILAKGKTHYKEEEVKKYLVKATKQWLADGLIDADLGFMPEEGYEYEVDEDRLDILLGNNPYRMKYVEVVKEIK